MKSTIRVYTDGACGPTNPGQGGWAALIEGDGLYKELSGGFAHTTNNRMELLAVVEALEWLDSDNPVVVTSDSMYVINGAVSWVYGWEKKGWTRGIKRGAVLPLLNVDLWKRLLAQKRRMPVQFKWVKGHNGHRQNEWCDATAENFNHYARANQTDLPVDAGYIAQCEMVAA